MKKNRLMGWLIFYFFLFSLGCFLGYLAYVQFQKTKNLLQTGIKTTAIVHSFSTHNSDGTTMYTPTFVFKDKSLQEHFYKSSVSSHPQPYVIGEKVKIVYERKDPENVKLISFWGLYAAPVILFMVASPLLVIGSSYLLYRLY